MYLCERDFEHNFRPFTSSNFYIFPDLKDFLDEHDNLRVNLLPDPAECFFGFYFGSHKPRPVSKLGSKDTQVDSVSIGASPNNYFTHDV